MVETAYAMPNISKTAGDLEMLFELVLSYGLLTSIISQFYPRSWNVQS